MNDEARRDESAPDKCPECGGTLVQDYKQSQVVCSKCGFTVREGILDRGPEWRSYDEDENDRSRAGAPTTITHHDNGLGSTFGASKRDAKGNLLPPQKRADYGRQRKWDFRSAVSGKRGVKEALDRAKTVSSHFGTSKRVHEDVCYYYRKASKEDLVRGRSKNAFLAASFDVACRSSPFPGKLEEFAEYLDVDISKAKEAKKLLIENVLKENPPYPGVSKAVHDLLDGLYIPPDLTEPIMGRIKEMIGKIRETSSFSGCSPSAIAAAVVYKACADKEFPVSEKSLSEKAERSRTAVQNSLKILEKTLRNQEDP